MDNYVITVPVEIDSKSMKESLKRQFTSVKEEIEGETLKIRITADAKDLDKIRQQISQMNPKDIPRIKLDIDRANFDKHLQSMTTMAEKSASELSSIFKKNVTKGFEPLDIGELIKKQFGATKRYSATAAKETIQELAKPLATPLDKDADYLTIVRRAEAYEQLNAAIKDMQKNHAKDFGKLGIDPKEMTQAMTDFYSQIGQMLTVDTNRENFTNQILASFETLRSNIGSMMQAIYDDAKRMGTGIGGAISDGIESGLGSGGGTGGVGQASAELDELDRQIEELSNKLKEAQDKLVSLQSGTSLSGKLSKNETATFISAIKEDIYNSLLELEKLGDNLPFDKSQHFMQLINSFYDLGGDPAKIGSTEALIDRIEEMQSRIYDLFDPNGDVDFGSIKNYIDVNAVKQQEQSIAELMRRLEELKQKRESLLGASGTGASGTGGSVSVDAKPDGEKFIADLQAQIQGKSVNVETKPISDGFQQELQDKVGTINVNVKPFIESDISSAMSGWHEADQTLDNLDHGLRERIAVFNKTTGYISNTYFSDEMDEVEGDLIKHIVDTAKEQANAMIHTHPTTLAAFSPEDISLAITALGDGITQSYVMGLEDVSHIDLSSVPKEALLKIEKIFADKVKQISDSAAAQLNSIGQGGNVLAKMALENSSEYQAKIREALLSTIEGVGLDPASILKTYSIDEFIQQFDGLPSVSQRMGEFNVKVSTQVGNIRADIEKELEQPFEVKTEISTGETSVRSKIETELAQPFDIITNADTSQIREDIDEKIKQPPFEIDIKPTNTLVDAINEMLKANNFIIDIGANGIAMQGNGGGTSSASNPYQYIYDMMSADDWMRRRLIKPDMPTKDDEIIELLKERMMAFNSKTGAHTNPFIFDKHASTRSGQLLRDDYGRFIGKGTYDTAFHSHPEVFSHMSINNLDNGRYGGDLSAFLWELVNANIEKQIIAAQKDVQLFDAKGFFDKYMAKFANDTKQQETLAEFTKQSEIARDNWGQNINRVIEAIEYINKFGDSFTFDMGYLTNASTGTDVSNALLSVLSRGSKTNAKDFLAYAKTMPETSSFKDTLGGFLTEQVSRMVGDAVPMQDIILGIKQALEHQVEIEFTNGSKAKMDVASAIMKSNFMWGNENDTQRRSDVVDRWITSQAWKSMGIDWDKFTEYIPMEEFKSRFSGATTQAGGVDMSKVMGESVNANINFDDVPGKLQAAIDAGAPYKVDISTDASSMQQVIQGGIDAGSPYQLTSIQLGPDMQIGEQIQQNIGSFEYLVKPDLDSSSDLAGKVKQALASGEPYKVIVEADTGKNVSGGKTVESPISSGTTTLPSQIETISESEVQAGQAGQQMGDQISDGANKASDAVNNLITVFRGISGKPFFDETSGSAWFSDVIETANTYTKGIGELYEAKIDLGNSMRIDARGASHDQIIYADTEEELQTALDIKKQLDEAKAAFAEKYKAYFDGGAKDISLVGDPKEYLAASDNIDLLESKLQKYLYTTEQLQEIAKSKGFDSLVIDNVLDSFGDGIFSSDKIGTSIAIFNQELIKTKQLIEDINSYKPSNETPVSTVSGASSSTAPVLSASAQSQQTTNDAATQEASGLEQLILKLGEVTTAIEQKTNAFSAEGQTVDGVVQQEINMLDALLGEVNMIIQDLSKLSTAITSLPEIKLEMGEIGEGSLNEQLISFIERLQQAINQLDATKLSSFGTALKEVEVNNKHIDNMLNLAIAIEDLAEMLNKLNSGMDGSNVFSSINELLKHADQLKDLAKIISTPTKQRKAAIEQAGLSKDKANAEAEKYYDNIDKYYQIQDDLNYKKVIGDTERRSLKSIAEEEKLLRAIEEYEARINQKREQGIPLTEKEVAALQKRKELEKEVKERYAENVVDTKEKAVKGVQTSISVLEKNIDSFATDKEYMGQQGVVDALRGKLQEVKQLGISIKNIDLVGEDDISRAQKLIDEIRKGYRNAITNKDFQIAPEKQRSGYQSKAASWLQKNTAAPKELRAEVQGLYNELSSDVPASRLQEIATRLNQIQAEAAAAGRTGKSFADSLKHSFGNLARYLMSFASFYRIIGVIRKAITTVKELDTALMEVRKVSTESFSSLKQWQKLSFKQADEVGGSAVQIEKSTAAWLRLGKSFEEAQEAAQASVKLLNVSEFTNIDDATTSLVSMRQAFQDLTYEDFIDKLNGVGDNFSSSTDQLAQGMKNVSSVLKVAGNDIDQSLALLTAANFIGCELWKHNSKNIFNCVDCLKLYATIIRKRNYDGLKR